MSSMEPNQLYHRILGTPYQEGGPTPIVFLHGLMGFAANWGKIWPHFQESRPILVLDQRGHGKSFKPATGYDPSDYARDLHGLLGSLGAGSGTGPSGTSDASGFSGYSGWKKIIVVGHSMGGRVALRFASLFPEMTAALVLEDSGMEANPVRVNWIRGLLEKAPTPFANREAAKKYFDKEYASDLMTGGFLFSNLVADESGRMDWRFQKNGMVETIERGRALDAMGELATLRAPTLIIRGERSREFPRDEAERMAALREGISLEEIPGAGHFVHAEKPVEFCRILEGFLAEL